MDCNRKRKRKKPFICKRTYFDGAAYFDGSIDNVYNMLVYGYPCLTFLPKSAETRTQRHVLKHRARRASHLHHDTLLPGRKKCRARGVPIGL